MISSTQLSQSEQEELIKQLEIFKIQGRDKRSRPILLVIGKRFPAALVGVDALKKHLRDEIIPGLGGRPFSVVYVHTAVSRGENFPGVAALKSLYDAVPDSVRENMGTFYFLHPGIQSRLFLATFGRFIFSGGGGGLYCKVKYVNRVEFLWSGVRRSGIELPEFVYEVDEEMEERGGPTVDYGMESDHPRVVNGEPVIDYSAVSSYSMRWIA
ncbi:hypothetical protein ACP275_03G082600 [Erythranthe tilingii]